MKKSLLILLFFITVSMGFAQTTLTTAVDFTVTDTDGNTFNLFSTLASGKYVLIDFFYTT
jgi:cytochrome oxidase Cu insertion factor (SCO1/SenC/PrrC family)